MYLFNVTVSLLFCIYTEKKQTRVTRKLNNNNNNKNSSQKLNDKEFRPDSDQTHVTKWSGCWSILQGGVEIAHLVTVEAKGPGGAGQGARGSCLAWGTDAAVRSTLTRAVRTRQGAVRSKVSRNTSCGDNTLRQLHSRYRL